MVFPDFVEWFSTVLSDARPSMIVAIARGAVRFLQLHHGGALPCEMPFLSHEALPFLPASAIQGARILIFDDSVIYGSTMARVKEYLEGRGAIVFCSAYAIDRETFLGETQDSRNSSTPSRFVKTAVIARHKMWRSSIRQHHGMLVRSILQSPLHYNLDFPTICLRVPTFLSSDGALIAHLLYKTGLFDQVTDVSSPLSVSYGIPRYSAILRTQTWLGLAADGISFRPYAKLRLTLIPSVGELRITPVMQLAMQQSVNHRNVRFESQRIQELWRQLVPPPDDKDISYHRSLFRLLTAFAGIVVSRDICNRVAAVLQQDFPVAGMSLTCDDVRFVLGDENARAIQHIWDDMQREPIEGLVNGQQTERVSPEIPNAPELRARMLEIMTRTPHFRPCEEELLCESMGKLFLALREATDSQKHRRARPDASRLDTGITFESARALLYDTNRQTTEPNEISLALDMFIDRGLAVPKVIAEQGTFFRVFYCGEDEEDQDIFQFKQALFLAYGAYLKKKKKNMDEMLSQFAMQKLCVALKDLMPWLPISTMPYKFGFTSTIGHEQLIKSLTRSPLAPFQLERKGNQEILAPNPWYVSPVSPVWDDAVNERNFFDAFDYTATAFSKMSHEAILLLTTCRTHPHAFNAVAFEAHTWASYGENSFGGLLMSVESALHNNREILRVSLDYLYWCIRYVTEAHTKRRIFYYEYERRFSEVREAFCSQGQGGERWWNFIQGKNLLVPDRDPEIEHRFMSLLPFLDLFQHLTTFIGRVLEEACLISRESLESAFNEKGVSLTWRQFDWFTGADRTESSNAYNKKIVTGTFPGRSMLAGRLSTDGPPDDKNKLDWACQSVKRMRTCFDQLAKTLQEYCKKYQVSEGNFPFSPDNNQRQLPDGSIERKRENVFLLTLDVIKGTDQEQTKKMKEEIGSVYRAFKSKGLVFEDTGNDAFIACCDDPAVLWDAACAIRTRGEDLMVKGQAFGGTRKGLYFGMVLVTEKPNGETLITDGRIPHCLPLAFSMLGGVDEHANATKKNANAVLIVEERTAERCAAMLKLDLKALPLVQVQSKHFGGPCHILELL